MSNKQFTDKYFDLIEKLMSFIAHNGKGVKELPQDASFVAFSSKNSELNRYSQQILDSLMQDSEDKPIVKAEQKNTKDWTFTTVTP